MDHQGGDSSERGADDQDSVPCPGNADDIVFIGLAPFCGDMPPAEKPGRIRGIADQGQAGLRPARLAGAVNCMDWHPVLALRSEGLDGHWYHTRSQSGIPYHASVVI
jgi:hypothetical protein